MTISLRYVFGIFGILLGASSVLGANCNLDFDRTTCPSGRVNNRECDGYCSTDDCCSPDEVVTCGSSNFQDGSCQNDEAIYGITGDAVCPDGICTVDICCATYSPECGAHFDFDECMSNGGDYVGTGVGDGTDVCTDGLCTPEKCCGPDDTEVVTCGSSNFQDGVCNDGHSFSIEYDAVCPNGICTDEICCDYPPISCGQSFGYGECLCGPTYEEGCVGTGGTEVGTGVDGHEICPNYVCTPEICCGPDDKNSCEEHFDGDLCKGGIGNLLPGIICKNDCDGAQCCLRGGKCKTHNCFRGPGLCKCKEGNKYRR